MGGLAMRPANDVLLLLLLLLLVLLVVWFL